MHGGKLPNSNSVHAWEPVVVWYRTHLIIRVSSNPQRVRECRDNPLVVNMSQCVWLVTIIHGRITSSGDSFHAINDGICVSLHVTRGTILIVQRYNWTFGSLNTRQIIVKCLPTNVRTATYPIPDIGVSTKAVSFGSLYLTAVSPLIN